MRKQDHLLGLIKSLNANEKRNFRLFAVRHQEDTDYLKLFDALEGVEIYNANALSRVLNITLTQLQRSKSYLARILLKSLRFYNDGLSADANLSNTIIEIEDLIARRLYDYATELLDKALLYAEEKKCYRAMPSIIKLKLGIALLTGDFDEVVKLDARMQNALAVLKEEHEVQFMTALVAQFERRRRPSEEFLYHDSALFYVNPEALHSKSAMLGWFTMMSNYLLATDQLPEIIVKHARKVISIFEADKELQESAPLQYIRSFAMLFTLEANAGNYDKSWDDGEKLLVIISRYKKFIQPGEVNHYLEFTETVRSTVAFYQGNYQKSVALAQYMYGRKQQLNDYMRFAVFFNLSRALLHEHRAAAAMSILEELIELGPDLRGDLQPYLRPLLILAQFDMDNYQVIPYLVRSTRSWMKRQKITETGVDIFLSQAYAVAKAPISKRKQEWAKLLAAIEKGSLSMLNKEIHLSRWIKAFMHG